MVTSRSRSGARSRRKGQAFELAVRDHVRAALPHLQELTVRRSNQAERAWDSDLIVEGPTSLPEWLLSLWLECEHANNPDPRAKMAQAVRDAGRYASRVGRARHPVVVWRRTGARVVNATTTLATLQTLLGAPLGVDSPGSGSLVTLSLPDFLAAVDRRQTS